MENNKKDMLRRAIVLSFVFGFIFLLIGLIVSSKMFFNVGVRCPFKELFNWNCPGCGGTRMAVALLHGDIYQAIRYNAFVVITLPVLVCVFIKQAYIYIRYNLLISWLDKFLIAYAIGLTMFGIIRNIEMFSWLAPISVG